MTGARPDDGAFERLDLEAFFADPQFASPSISPDGAWIAYLAPADGRRNIWVRGVDEDHEDAVCVTRDTQRGVTTYYWAGDSRRLLYLQDSDGDEDWHLYRADLDRPGEAAVDLTPLPPGSRVIAVEPFRPRPGSVLVWMNPRPTSIDAFLVDVATGATALHREQGRPGDVVLLDRDAEPAFLTRTVEDGTVEVHAVDAATGDTRLLRRLGGAEHPMGVQPQQVNADGRGLLLGSYHGGDDLRLVRVDRETGEETVVAAMDGHDLDTSGVLLPDVLPPAVYTSRRDGEVLAARFVGDRPHVEAVAPRFAAVLAALQGLSDGVLATLSSDEAEQRWVATFTHDRAPGVAWFYDHASGTSRLLFRSLPHLDPAALAPMMPVAFPARDGLPLHGFLTLPVGVEPRPLPLVLLVHGGPWAHDSWGYQPEVQFLAARGHAVLQVNFRGSTGHGRRHLLAGVGEFGGAMHNDLVDAVDWAVAQGYAERNRVGILGGSYGGYAALVAATDHERFAAAVAYVGISDLARFVRTLPPFGRPYFVNSFYRYIGDPDVPEQEADMTARSPISMVDRMRVPLLVAQGANDVRVPREQSDALVAALRARDVPVEYLVADDEGHGFANPENRIRLYRAVERHFARHLTV